MAKTKRVEQVAEQIQHILGSVIQSEIKDPRLGFVTIMSVHVSPDLYHANINISVMGDEAVRQESLQTLERARSFLRRQLGQELQLRSVPELHFHLDTTLDTREHMETLFRQVEEDRRVNPPQIDEGL